MFTSHTAWGRRVALAAGLILLGCAGPAAAQQQQQQQGAASLPFMNPCLPLDQRVNDLVSRLTLEEKANQLINTTAAIPRLQIPAYNWWNEALHGVVTSSVTVFPQVIGLGATFNAPLIKQMSTVISDEARARYNQSIQQPAAAGGAGGGGMGRGAGLDFWAPNINIFRDPRWGRGQETYGEDPFLTARMGVNFVQGMQGDDPKYFKTVSTPKHFAVHSGPEPTRHFEDVSVSLHDEDDTYLPAFRAAVVEGKADSVMCAYNRINGEAGLRQQVPAAGHPARRLAFQRLRDLRLRRRFRHLQQARRGPPHREDPAEAAAMVLKYRRRYRLPVRRPRRAAYLEAMQKGLVTQGSGREPEAPLQGALPTRHVRSA